MTAPRGCFPLRCEARGGEGDGCLLRGTSTFLLHEPGSACRWDWAPGAWLPAPAREGRAQPWGAPAGEGRPRPLPPVAQGTAIAHLDGWCGMRTQPEPAKPCPSSPRRKVQKEKGREEAEGQRHLGWRGGRASWDTVGEGGCLRAVFPHGAILS